MVKAGGLGNDIRDLLGRQCTGVDERKAISIGHYFVSSGVYTVFGGILQTTGAPVFQDYLFKEMENMYGGMWDMYTDPIKHAPAIIAPTSTKNVKHWASTRLRDRVLMDMAERQALEG